MKMAEQEMIVKYIRNDDGTFNMKYIGELIRCKDCKYHDNQDTSTGWLPCMNMLTEPKWYCGSGERREQDDS